ncbi:phosphoribosylaminoimidazole-succinocarboxamide synthase [Shewanella sp. NFH-SH190041]|uniref:phosphoribosylaminoimidazolesuccinocarboxamide synthase n=1 Tax=Shewanella sp. NFH-SH190041 TaxID=2950245 RepID=UPI0021C32AE5|nr:phosphoribosylaminoimidazolesuccinocarboxamide synthase [Shewanella sp. NFH-SH190041]BDM63126.1 phosphoribosylaminoimidazole-succinocarboxamide synthase [Shewanella sp. NFH-SH190041]
MTPADAVLAINNDLPICTDRPVHSGKVRSVYWLTDADSRRLINQRHYPVPADTPLAVMVISDRISAFDCIFHGEGGMQGIPGKGAALNTIANHWFELFRQHGLADSHIVDIPHPLVWIVRQARPLKIEAIIRRYITGSMWRAYAAGERVFCGIRLPEGLQQNQQLPQPLLTPSTKGILTGLTGVPEQDDVNVSRQQLQDNYQAFGFNCVEDIDTYEQLLQRGFALISDALAKQDMLFVDTKFEFGYVKDKDGRDQLIYMDEVGTPDSSRIWDGAAFRDGRIVENSKEGFRQFLLQYFPDADILLNKDKMEQRQALARETALPEEIMLQTSRIYTDMAAKITGKPLPLTQQPRAKIIQVLQQYGLID